MQDAAIVKRIRAKHASLRGVMNERVRRQWAASEALDLGWGEHRRGGNWYVA